LFVSPGDLFFKQGKEHRKAVYKIEQDSARSVPDNDNGGKDTRRIQKHTRNAEKINAFFRIHAMITGSAAQAYDGAPRLHV
jgi:hypothetical protein